MRSKKLEEKKSIVLKDEDLTVLEAEFLDKDYIIEPVYHNCRIDKGGQRFYVRYFDEGNYIKAPSFSEIMNKVLGVDYFLAQWMAEKGKEKAEFIARNSAAYGTYMHIIFSEILRGKTVPLDENWFFNEIEIFCEKNGYDFKELKIWYKEERRKVIDDIVGFICWIKDYNIRPIAMEYPLMHPEGKWAGMSDLICKMTIEEKLEGEIFKVDITAMIDFKSGFKPQFYEDNEIQLYAYKELWNMEFPNMPIERVYNYGCNNFQRKSLQKYLEKGSHGRFKPYRFKDQTESIHVSKWSHYVELYHMNPENLVFPKKFEYQPLISIDKNSDLSEIIQEYDVIEGLITELNEQTKVSDDPEVQDLTEKLSEDLKDE